MADNKQGTGVYQRFTAWGRKTIRETVGELRKVSWPSRQETINLTRIVLIVILITAALLGGLDVIFGWLFGLLFGA